MSKRILVVEDNERNRILLRDVLRYYGYEAIEADNGAEGVKKAREHLPDLIFLDIQMPVMDGFTALKIMKNIPETRNIKVIAITSFAMIGDKERILGAGFDDYISKPIDTRKLPLIVKQYLEDG